MARASVASFGDTGSVHFRGGNLNSANDGLNSGMGRACSAAKALWMLWFTGLQMSKADVSVHLSGGLTYVVRISLLRERDWPVEICVWMGYALVACAH